MLLLNLHWTIFMSQHRLESDLLGQKEIPAQAYYGVQTLRALENFNLSATKLYHFPLFIKALAMVKSACAEANYRTELLPENKRKAIQFACNELIQDKYQDQFQIDMLQGGAGTSTNMNANEVIANIALEFMGHAKGEYQYLHPNNDVNMSQSTNDVYPTAIKLGLLLSLEKLTQPFNALIESLAQKGIEFANVVKMGRTQLQDAVPMTLGQEFSGFSVTLKKDIDKIIDISSETLCYVNLGGTAIGTGINASEQYKKEALAALSNITQRPMMTAPHLIEASSDMGDFVLLSGLLKRTATKLSKIANDLRLLSSGPRTGINEINLEPRQPGSSIMPGKVNPVIPEAVNIACYQIIANDLAITLAAESGQLQLNAMEPLIALKLFESIDLLEKTVKMFKNYCIDSVTANASQCKNFVDNSIGIITALNPYLGYETTTRIAKAANETGKSIFTIIEDEKLLSKQSLDDIFSIKNLVNF